jgi:glycine C-acetyltransferase
VIFFVNNGNVGRNESQLARRIDMSSNSQVKEGRAADLFAKCGGDGGYFGNYRNRDSNYFIEPILEGPIGARMRFQGKRVIVWSVNNYLGIAGRDEVKAAVGKAIESYGTWSPMGSRLLTGNTPRHMELEQRLACFCQKPASVVFNYGYLGVLGTISSLVGPNDVVIIDKLSHACIVDAAMLATARRRRQLRVFEHNDLDSLERRLQEVDRERRGGILIVTEGVFGMTGELAPLREICAIKDRYSARLLVDDAHGFGVMGEEGRGTGEHFAVQHDIDLYFTTFAKALAAIGGVTAGKEQVVKYIKYNARPNIFAKSLPSVFVEAIFTALDLVSTRPELKGQLWAIAKLLQDGFRQLGFSIGNTQSPLTPVYIEAGDEQVLTTMIRMLRDGYGVFVSGVTYPVVPRGIALFRLVPTADHTEEDVTITLDAFRRVRDATYRLAPR